MDICLKGVARIIAIAGDESYLSTLDDMWNSDQDLHEVLETITGSTDCTNSLGNQIRIFVNNPIHSNFSSAKEPDTPSASVDAGSR
jgi:hypothetical protein